MPKRARLEATAAKPPASIGDALKNDLRTKQMQPSGKKQLAADPDAPKQPELAAWQTDEAAPFPRGGGSALTPLEYKAITTAAKEDALVETSGGGAVDPDVLPPPSAMGGGSSDLLRAHTLLRKQLTAGVRVMGAVSEVHSDRLLLQLPNRIPGRVGREEISDELHAALADDSLGAAPDLRKLFSKGEVLCCAVLPLASRGSTAVQRGKAAAPPVELTLRLSLVQRAALAGGARGDALRARGAEQAAPGPRPAPRAAAARGFQERGGRRAGGQRAKVLRGGEGEAACAEMEIGRSIWFDRVQPQLREWWSRKDRDTCVSEGELKQR